MQPTINDKAVGFMILDTGASGFVIEKDAADRLGLRAFGELFVSGLAHKVRAHGPRAGVHVAHVRYSRVLGNNLGF